MPIYTAYRLASDGTKTREAQDRDYEDDSDVRAWARVMMADNKALAGVEVWCGERLVFDLHRKADGG